MEMSVTEVIFSFLGGLGIFLYGLKIMGDGFKHQQETGYEIF
ncbi:Na/Pi cotransporter II-related protein [Staphylococcus aureus]|nr:Na/Pi cotransporter II-related protein [Staphylococcus aureus]